MRENRPSGLMRGGEQMVIGVKPLNPSLPAYSTLASHNDLQSQKAAVKRGEFFAHVLAAGFAVAG
jgi:hypothetical protein